MSITTTPQKARVYAVLDNPPVVFACRVNQAFSTHDKVFEFTYDTPGSYVYTDILEGMTILLGSSAGEYDKGITYCRKAATTTKIFCGETSEVAWTDNLYVTILQDWSIWTEYLRYSSTNIVYMKYDVVYSDQHKKFKPVPILGTDRVVRYEGAPVTVSFNGGSSYVPGSTIVSYSWTCPGTTISGGTTATPIVTIPTPGRFVVSLTVTSALGVTNTTHRSIHAWSNQDYIVDGVTKTAFPLTEVSTGSLSGDFESGGWFWTMNVLNGTTGIRKRTKVILVAEEWYGDTKTNYGEVTGAENIIAIGWVDKERVILDPQQGNVELSIQGTHYWLQQIHNFVPVGIERSGGTPKAWTEMNPLTVDKVLWNLFVWRSTVTNCVDVFLSGDTKQATELIANGASLWDQVKQIAYNSILASPCCDRYGRITVQVEAVLLPNDGRSSVPNRGSISHDDCEQIDVDHVLVTPTAQVVLSGVSVSGGKGAALFSISRGHIPLHYGAPIKMERLVLSTQTLSNELAGNMLEKANVPYRFIFNNLLYNNRLVDICPRQFITANIEATDNPAGIAFSGNAIVKRITLALNEGAWDISWEAVPETKSVLSVDGDIPTDPNNPPWKPPKWPPIDIPIDPPIDIPLDPPVITPLGIVAILFNNYGVWAMDTINTPGSWFNVTTAFDWTLAELASLTLFELSPMGNAFLASNKYIWSQTVTEVTDRVDIATHDFWTSQGFDSDDGNFSINAIGFKQDSIYGLAVAAGYGLTNNVTKIYLLNEDGVTLDIKFSIGGYGNRNLFYPGSGQFTNYLDKWYLSCVYSDYALYARINSDLTGWDLSPTVMTFPVASLRMMHVHATAADFAYGTAFPSSGIKPGKFTSLGTIEEVIPAAGTYDSSGLPCTIACDPTGQYVMMASNFYTSGTLSKSSDFGASWTDFAASSFPSLSFDARSVANITNGRVYNLGDSNKWMICFNGTVYLDPGVPTYAYLHIFYTPDFGSTWEDWAGDIRESGVVPENASVRVIRHA